MKLIERFKEMSTDSRIKLFLTLLVLEFLLVFTILGTITITSQPSFCNICHEMRADVQAWKSSSHAEITCYGCHSEGNIAAFLLHKVESLKEVYFHLTGSFEKPINGDGEYAKHMSNEPCKRCHSLNRKVTPSKGMIIDHPKHEEKDITCVTCHNRVGHPEIKGYLVDEKEGDEKDHVQQVSLKPGSVVKVPVDTKPYEDHMEMRFCMVCHTGEKDKGPRECKTCHPSGFELKPEDHNDPNWLPAKEELQSVEAVHGIEAKEDMAGCLSCHKQEFCNKCHKVEIPHAKTWKEEHSKLFGEQGKIALVGVAPQECVMCHPQANFCDACHHDYDPAKGIWYSPQPGQNLHMIAVRDRGATDCFKCHLPTYCSHCHVRGTKE